MAQSPAFCKIRGKSTRNETLEFSLLDPSGRFLLSLVANQPDWSLLKIPHARALPGVRWKLHNLSQLQKANRKKFTEQSEALARLLKS